MSIAWRFKLRGNHDLREQSMMQRAFVSTSPAELVMRDGKHPKDSVCVRMLVMARVAKPSKTQPAVVGAQHVYTTLRSQDCNRTLGWTTFCRVLLRC